MLTKFVKYQVTLTSKIFQFGKNRNLLIHHGLLGSAQSFSHPDLLNICSKYANIHLIDARNHGDSPRTESHSIQELSDDLFEYLSAHNLLKSSKKLTLMGHSMGGQTLMDFTKRYDSAQIQASIDKIVIVDIPTTPIKKGQNFIKTGTMMKNLLKINMDQSLTEIHKEIDKYAVNKSVAARVKQILIENGPTYKWKVNMDVLAFEGWKHIGSFQLSRNNPGRWRSSVQIIYGQLSNYFNQQQFHLFRKYYPQLSKQNCHKIPQAGHWLQDDNLESFCSTIDHILNKNI